MIMISTENYLKALMHIEFDNQQATTSAIASRLSVSAASITEMTRRLAEEGLVEYIPYKPVVLTGQGRELAVQVVRRHRLWEMFLHKVLKMTWDQVHDEAENLEHCSSEKLIDNIDAFLGNPRFDPHGDPIPDKEGIFPEIPGSRLLSECQVGEMYNIVRVKDRSRDLMEYFSDFGFYLGRNIFLHHRLKDDQSLVVELGQQKTVISHFIASNIEVVGSKTLEDLKINEKGIVDEVNASGLLRSRLLDLGFTGGTEIEKTMIAPSGDPASYRVRDTTIALRNDEARKILLKNGR
ncbi:MAG TPA: metal-dependent transcriptional regulator [Bacteroides sp.]|nr:metal-dependent transcriptional regulator [Bacteroides sp.]